MERPHEPSWVSAHIFCRGKPYREDCDRVLLEVVEPFVRTRAPQSRPYFFIRYGKAGPHVRLRLRVPASEVLALRHALEVHVARTLAPELAGTPSDLDEAGAEPSSHPSLWWVPYLPETARYAGPEAVILAEEWFWRSSQAALAVFGEISPLDLEARLGVAVAAMVVLLRGMTPVPDHAVEVLTFHQEHWLYAVGESWSPDVLRSRFDTGFMENANLLEEQVATLWTLCGEAPEALPAPFDAYAEDVARLAAQLEVLASRGALRNEADQPLDFRAGVNMLAPVYMHMMNNRLGVYPVEEAYLAHLLARTLERVRGENGASAR